MVGRMQLAVETGVGMASDREVDFAAYMAARQPSLLRTAYLLSGDRHTAEDLVQVTFAKLYLSWDKVQRRELVDGYVRRILVNEHASLWRRAFKRREVVADVLPETRTVDRTDDGEGAALWAFVQTAGQAVLVVGAHRSSSRAVPRLIPGWSWTRDRIAASARLACDLTVPTEMPSTSAVSASERSS